MMSPLNREFMNYCALHVNNLNEFNAEITKLIQHNRPKKAIDHGELWRLLKQTHHDYLKEPHQNPDNFGEFLSWKYPISRMILEAKY